MQCSGVKFYWQEFSVAYLEVCRKLIAILSNCKYLHIYVFIYIYIVHTYNIYYIYIVYIKQCNNVNKKHWNIQTKILKKWPHV